MYYNLIVERITGENVTVDYNLIVDLLQKLYNSTSFSTFPYLYGDCNSSESIERYNSGNCIAMSIYLLNSLKKRGIVSYLIPASVPTIYRDLQYLHICHVALFIPCKDYNYIVDPAFYFQYPIEYNKITKTCNKIINKSIYETETEINNDIKNYTTLKKIIPQIKTLEKNLRLNEYQTIPKNVDYCQCYFEKNKNDTWNYYIVNILNPDRAIGNFFLTIKKNPFITTHIIDENGICVCDYYIKTDKDNIYIKHNSKTSTFKITDFIESPLCNKLETILYSFFKGNLRKWLLLKIQL